MSPQPAHLDEVRACLEKILTSAAFAGAPRDQAFLRFVVEEGIAGRGGELKETVIATRVFGRKSDYDPRFDSIVRVVASHVRKRLDQYYLTDGAPDPVAISLPRGGYAPVFRNAEATAPSQPEATPAKRRAWPLVAAASLLVLAGLGWFLWGMSRNGDRTAIVVIPFANLDGTSESERMADALSEDITTELARGAALRVVARTSSLVFRKQGADVRTIGARLGVGSLLEGSVRKSGDRIKVTAQLIELRGGYHLWSESFEGEPARLPEFQDRITQAVRRHLGDSPHTPARSVPAVRPEAQELYFQARFLLRKGAKGRADAVPLLQRAIALEPGYTVAHAALATAYSTMAYHYEGAIDDLAAKAKAAGRRTLELDPESAEACIALANVAYARDRDWGAAEMWFRKALAVGPNFARARTGYGLYLLSRGRAGEAVEQMERARSLDPLSSLAGNDLAVGLYCGRRYKDALAATSRTLAVQPDFAYARVVRGMCLTELGDFAGAASELYQAMPSIGRANVVLGAVGYRLARAGQRGEAETVLREIESAGSRFHAAVVAAGMGDRARCLDLLGRALDAGETDAIFFPSHPAFAHMQGETGFRALLARVGL